MLQKKKNAAHSIITYKMFTALQLCFSVPLNAHSIFIKLVYTPNQSRKCATVPGFTWRYKLGHDSRSQIWQGAWSLISQERILQELVLSF